MPSKPRKQDTPDSARQRLERARGLRQALLGTRFDPRDIDALKREGRADPMPQFDRIVRCPGTMGGKACIRGTRATVGMVVGQVGAGRSIDELLADYPYLQREDILQALRYAAWRAEQCEVELADR